jgi:predicted DNA binding protein
MFFRVILKHVDCWSDLLSKYPYIYGELLNQKFLNNTTASINLIFSRIGNKNEFVENNTNVFGDFLHEIKTDENVMKIEKLQSIQNKNSQIIRMKIRIYNAISEVVEMYDSPYFREIIYKGYEIWYIFSWYDNYNKILKEINKRALLIDYKKLDLDTFTNQIKLIDSSKQSNLLDEMYNIGYYSKSKDCSLRDIAKNYGMSKSNLAKKLKNSEIGAIEFYLDSILKSTDIDKILINKSRIRTPKSGIH